MATEPKRRKNGIPTGNAGEYFVMGELLKRGFDAQLAGRNTKGYDLLVGREEDGSLRKVQVKTSRAGRQWFVRTTDFEGKRLGQVTVYVALGQERSSKPVQYFIVENRCVKGCVYHPGRWKLHGILRRNAVERYQDRWDDLRT